MRVVFLSTIVLMLMLSIVPPKRGLSQINTSDTSSKKIDSLSQVLNESIDDVSFASDSVFSKIVRNQKQAERISKRKPKTIIKRIIVDNPVIVPNQESIESDDSKNMDYGFVERVITDCDTVIVYKYEKPCLIKRVVTHIKTKSNEIFRKNR